MAAERSCQRTSRIQVASRCSDWPTGDQSYWMMSRACTALAELCPKDSSGQVCTLCTPSDQRLVYTFQLHRAYKLAVHLLR